MPNIIKQVVSDGSDSGTQSIKMLVKGNGQIINDSDSGTQSIKMIVKDNERGPQGEQGEAGMAATINAGQVYIVPEGEQAVINTGTSSNATFDFYIPKGAKGDPGEDGAIHYTAGSGIEITSDNVINATGSAVATWGDIEGTLSDQTDLKNALDEKQHTLTAGTNITIEDNTISASGGTYTAGTGLNLTGNEFSVDTTTIAEKSDIPTVNNATLTIQNNGTSVATFTANSASDTTANIVSPVQIGSVISQPTSVAYVDTANIVDEAVTADKIDFTTLGGNYSTSEADTGFTWIDGKIIYKKTVDIGNLPNNTSKSVAHNISNLSTLVKIEGAAKSSTGFLPLPTVLTVAANQVGVTVDSTNVNIYTGLDRSSYSGYVTLYYTKSN